MVKRAVGAFLAAVLMLLPLSGCSMLKLNKAFDSSAVVSATFMYGKSSVLISDSDAIAQLGTVVNSGRSVAVDTLNVSVPLVRVSTVGKGDRVQTLSIYDFAAESGYAYILAQDGNYYEVNRAELFKLLSGDSFSALYSEHSLPSATISVEGKLGELPPSDGSWSYKRFDGNFYNAPPLTPPQPYKYVITAPASPDITFSLAPTSVTITVMHKGKELFSGSLEQLKDFKMASGGRYEYMVNANWSEAALKELRGNALYTFCIDYNPQASFELSTTESDPGEALVIYAHGLAGKQITVNSPFKFEPEFFDYDEMRVCIFPLSYLNQAGTYTLELSSESAYAKYAITLKDKKFEVQELTVDNETANSTIKSDEANAEFTKIIQPLKAVRDKEKYFQGKFILPVSGEITTEFGSARSINGTISERHSGIDIAAKRGTKVKASGAGRVLYAGKLKLTGNTVLIEHGFGLKTWYYHMDSLNVKTDDMVKQGDVIGKVGSTGFSTGPHLHFGMSVNGVFINPNTAIKHVLID